MISLVDFKDKTLIILRAGDFSQFFIGLEDYRGGESFKSQIFEGVFDVTAQEVGHFDFRLFLVVKIGLEGGGILAIQRGKLLFDF